MQASRFTPKIRNKCCSQNMWQRPHSVLKPQLPFSLHFQPSPSSPRVRSLNESTHTIPRNLYYTWLSNHHDIITPAAARRLSSDYVTCMLQSVGLHEGSTYVFARLRRYNLTAQVLAQLPKIEVTRRIGKVRRIDTVSNKPRWIFFSVLVLRGVIIELSTTARSVRGWPAYVACLCS